MIAKPVSPREELADAELLERYLARRGPESEDAFRALVERHGPMVLGTCRHVLNQAQDAEDAFQATFLVLARKGASIQNRKALAGWLHEVAHRIAVRSRVGAFRRRALERQGMAMSAPDFEPDDQDEQTAWKELGPVLHDEIDRLPEKYRVPVVLSYLEGRTNEEVACLLQWPVGTVKGRLSRARDLLRSRLSRRGLALSAAFLVRSLKRGRAAGVAVPPELVQKTVRLAMGRGLPLAGPGPSGPAAESGFPETLALKDVARKGTPPNPIKLANRPGRCLAAAIRSRRLRLILVAVFIFLLSAPIGASISILAVGGGFSELRSLLPVRHPWPKPHSHCQ